ncbi:MAG: glycosyltransferase family 4 protein [Gemmobacter sp.]|nr:glycosyltransferase family 4 protein [Gemmobacter sp.]
MHVVIYTRYWKIGGIERIIQSLTAGLRPMGYRFSIITEDLPDPDNQFDLGPDTPIYFREASPFTAENEAALRRLILRLAPDVAVAMGSSRALYKLPRSLVDTDIPVVLSEHNSSAHICEKACSDRPIFWGRSAAMAIWCMCWWRISGWRPLSQSGSGSSAIRWRGKAALPMCRISGGGAPRGM